MRNNKPIIILIVVISILVIGVIGGVIFIAIKNNKGTGKVVVNATTNNNEAEEQKVDDFNEQFSGYEGEEISGTLVKSLLSAVILSNNSDEEHQITVKIIDTDLEDGTTDTTDLSKVQQSINKNDIYEVKYDKENGYISEITIEKTSGADISPEAQRFNQKFTSYQDKTITGKKVKGELATLIKESNKANTEHKIIIYSGDLTSINDIKDEANYKITLSFDEEGYLNRIDADEEENSNQGNNENYFSDNDVNEIVNEVLNTANNALAEEFNTMFTSYEGTGRSASSIRTLLTIVNKTNETHSDKHPIEVDMPELKTSKKYSVELEYDDQGYINKIIITEE